MDLLWSDVRLALPAEHVSRDEGGDGVDAAARPAGVGDAHCVTVAAPVALSSKRTHFHSETSHKKSLLSPAE